MTASYLALGHRLTDAVSLAKKYLTQALQTGADITIGSGHGSVNHFFAPRVLTPLNPIKDEKVHPVPCVFRVEMRGEV